jgi:hypothetical protein
LIAGDGALDHKQASRGIMKSSNDNNLKLFTEYFSKPLSFRKICRLEIFKRRLPRLNMNHNGNPQQANRGNAIHYRH